VPAQNKTNKRACQQWTFVERGAQQPFADQEQLNGRIIDDALVLLGRVDTMHGCHSLSGMPKLLTSPGAMVQLIPRF
jgi:hypothetical protein